MHHSPACIIRQLMTDHMTAKHKVVITADIAQVILESGVKLQNGPNNHTLDTNIIQKAYFSNAS